MVAAISTISPDSKLQETPQNSTGISRPPLLPPSSERENGIKANRRSRPRGREIPSRYMSMSPSCSTSSSSSSSSGSSSTRNSNSASVTTVTSSSNSSISRRFPSPIVSRPSSTDSAPKRSQSADRRRSVSANANGGEVSAASKMLVTSTRSLSVSFQGESFSFPISKAKAVNSPPSKVDSRKATPERRRTTPVRRKVDGDQQADQHSQRWPARNRQLNMTSRSLECSNGERKELAVSSFDGLLNLDSNGADLTASDTDSVSSGSTSGAHESSKIIASARFWQETNMRLRRLQDSVNPSSRTVTPKATQSRKFSDGSLASPRATSSPVRGAVRSASPSKLMTPLTPSPVRGISPSRIRSSIAGSLNSSFYDSPSVLSYLVDVRRGKVGENRIIDAHQLRLLYNHHLQWRFVNAKTDIAQLDQKRIVEKNLWNSWITITGLRDSVRHKRAHLQLLKQKLKLTSILKGQVNYLDEWSLMDDDHSSSLQGAIEALKASTLRLPVVGGAIVDIQCVKEAVSSAVDVMQAMASSICSLLTKVEEVNCLKSELVNVAAKERALLGQCKDVLSALAALEVKDSSLRTHALQLTRLPIA